MKKGDRKKKKIMICLLAIVMLFSLVGCKKEQTLKDGYYTAHMDGYDFGWQEFVTICVSNGEIVTVEYNAAAETGFIKSWDIAYMRNMNPLQGTYPNNYTRRYAAQFLEKQSSDIDIITGATSSGKNFKVLTEALLEKAKEGDSSVAIVPYPNK